MSGFVTAFLVQPCNILQIMIQKLSNLFFIYQDYNMFVIRASINIYYQLNQLMKEQQDPKVVKANSSSCLFNKDKFSKFDKYQSEQSDQDQITKKSLCRFYLRGNCPFSKQECNFAHGIKDLNFTPYDSQKQQNIKNAYLDFRFNHPINQLEMSVSQDNKNYLSLSQFQKQYAKATSTKKYNETNSQYMENKQQTFPQGEYKNMKQESDLLQKQEEQKPQSKQQQKKKKKRKEYEHRNKQGNSEQTYSRGKVYSLQEINENRNLKIEIRKYFHKNQFKLFLQLIERTYSQAQHQPKEQNYKFYYEILQIEYFRVGFNKLMTRIKLSFLIDYLQYEYKGGHFKFCSLLPPLLNRTMTFYIRLPPFDAIISHYRQIYQKIVQDFKKIGQPIKQEDVRLTMIRAVRQWDKIPPLIQILRIKHCTFRQFFIRYVMKHSNEVSESEIKLDWINEQSIQIAQIHKIIEEQIRNKQYCIVYNDILSKNPKYNKNLVHKCVQNQIAQQQKVDKKMAKDMVRQSQKLIIVKCYNIKTEIITKQRFLKPDAKYEHQFGITLPIIIEDIVQFLYINNKKLQQSEKVDSSTDGNAKLDKEQIWKIPHRIRQNTPDLLQQYRIVDIASAQDFCQHLNSQQFLKQATILGVDLQGSLVEQNGYLSLIQINNYSIKTIYLIDYLTISKNQSHENIQKCKKLLIDILNDNNSVKVIHDSRNDGETLYNLLKKSSNKGKQDQKMEEKLNNQQKINLTNVLDTAASQQVIRQFCNPSYSDSRTPSLNQVLKKYGQNVNSLKQKFHEMWATKKQQPSLERPMSDQFRNYCSMDVLGLPKVYIAMSEVVNPYFLVLVSQLHANWSQNKYKQLGIKQKATQ